MPTSDNEQIEFVAMASFQMPTIQSPEDLVEAWETLRSGLHSRLPAQLRKPQKDALFSLLQGKSVLLCIGTGLNKFQLYFKRPKASYPMIEV